MGRLPSVVHSGTQRFSKIVPKVEKVTQFALLIYESAEAFATPNNDAADPYTGA
jgi:hypothetical protein